MLVKTLAQMADGSQGYIITERDCVDIIARNTKELMSWDRVANSEIKHWRTKFRMHPEINSVVALLQIEI